MRCSAILSIIIATEVAIVRPDRPSRRRPNREAKKTFDYWTPERIESAVPRDYVMDPVTGKRQLRTHTRSLQTTNKAIADADWKGGGAVNEAAGRILFSLNGGSYVCSGTVIKDHGTVGRSLVVTAAHCAYDEVANVHATNVLFVPRQDDGGSDASNRKCSDDFYGCWAMKLGVVDSRWRDGDWPSIIKYDYAIYVVPDQAGYFTPGYNNSNHVLDSAVKGLEVDFANEQGLVAGSTWGHFMGYSYSKDPNFRHCFDVLRARPAYGAWELPGCYLSGGSSGGPGLSNPTGNGKMYAVISYGSSGSPGMGGPALHNNSFSCVFERAKVANFTAGNVVLKYGGTPCAITTTSKPRPTSPQSRRPTAAPVRPPTSRPTSQPTRRPASAPVRPPTSTTCSTYKYRYTCRRVVGCNWIVGICKNV